MISEEQKLQIEQYLISKKLPLDILLEVKDHLILQIEDCMIGNNIDFEPAFLKVELAWEKQFIPVKYWIFYGSVKIPKIAKNIMKQKFNSILLKSFFLGLLFFLSSFLMIALSDNFKIFKIYYISSHSIFLLLAIFLYFFNLKHISYFKRDFKYKSKVNFTVYQQNIMLLLICFFGMSQVILNGGEHLFNFFDSEKNSSMVVLILLSNYRVFMYKFGIFGILNFNEHKKAIKKLQILN